MSKPIVPYRPIIFDTPIGFVKKVNDDGTVNVDLNMHPNCRCVTEPLVDPDVIETTGRRIEETKLLESDVENENRIRWKF